MNEELKGKRLLLLGSSMWRDQIRAIANEYGIHLTFAGNTPAPLDNVVDEVYRVNSIDHEQIKQFIREHHFDGVYIGGSELIISHACQYLNELHLPCYCTKEQWNALANKSRFKALCKQFGLPCNKSYEIDSPDIEYPVVTKPTDSSGSQGISICYNADELRKGYAMAQAAAPSGKALIEKFYKNNDSLMAYYTFSGGRIHSSAVSNRYPVRFDNPDCYVPGLHIYESNHKDDFRRRYEGQLQQMFSYLGLREGTLHMEVFCDGDDYCFNEAGYRYAGQVSFFPINYLTGVNQLEMDIIFALTGHSSLTGHTSLFPADVPRRKYYSMYVAHLAYGKIARIEGLEAFNQRPECVHMCISKSIGEEVNGPRSLNQSLGYIHLVHDTVDELRKLIKELHATVHVIDTEGREMLLEKIDWEDRKIDI